MQQNSMFVLVDVAIAHSCSKANFQSFLHCNDNTMFTAFLKTVE